jgi:hypothetical protein
MANLNSSAQALFGQVFGVFVNTNSSAFTAAQKVAQGKTLNTNPGLSMSRATIGAILQDSLVSAGLANDWSDIPDSTGAVIGQSALGVQIMNREQGSGSRTATDIFFTGDHCVTPAQSPILETTAGTADFFSTGNVLAAANTIPGAITYASIDNAGSSTYPNLTLVAVDGIQPSSLNAATGGYGDWFEAQAIPASGFATNALVVAIITDLQTPSSGPNTPQIVAIPSGNSGPAYPVSGTGTAETQTTGYSTLPYNYDIYVNPYTRSSNSCNDPEPLI